MSTRSGTGLGRAALVAAICIALDQITKGIVRGEVNPGERIDLFAGVEIVHVSNSGIAFGLLEGAGSIVLVIAAAAFAAMLGLFLLSAGRTGLWLPVGLLAGGAIGNLIDRVREGAVTDFIDPPRWPAFNLADVEITAGVLLLIAVYLLDPSDSRTVEPGPSSADS